MNTSTTRVSKAFVIQSVHSFSNLQKRPKISKKTRENRQTYSLEVAITFFEIFHKVSSNARNFQVSSLEVLTRSRRLPAISTTSLVLKPALIIGSCADMRHQTMCLFLLNPAGSYKIMGGLTIAKSVYLDQGSPSYGPRSHTANNEKILYLRKFCWFSGM